MASDIHDIVKKARVGTTLFYGPPLSDVYARQKLFCNDFEFEGSLDVLVAFYGSLVGSELLYGL